VTPEARPPTKYPLPLYLNQKYVFDVLSMMEGGFTQLETVTSRNVQQTEQGQGVSGDVGFSNVFGLLSVRLGGGRSKQERMEGEQAVSAERVHTPNSLFARMRERLFEESLVRTSFDEDLKAGDFIETIMRLERNPLVATLETLHSLTRMAVIFEQSGSGASGQKGGQRGGQKGQRRQASPDTSAQVEQQLRDLIDQLNTGQVIDLTAVPLAEGDPDVVLTLDTAYAADRSLTDLIDGEYRVLGKITRNLPDTSDESVNLLRKTSLGPLQAGLLEQLRQPLQEFGQVGVELPEFRTEIESPVVQVLPIAVFA
jgi:hypothetical protein